MYVCMYVCIYTYIYIYITYVVALSPRHGPKGKLLGVRDITHVLGNNSNNSINTSNTTSHYNIHSNNANDKPLIIIELQQRSEAARRHAARRSLTADANHH